MSTQPGQHEFDADAVQPIGPPLPKGGKPAEFEGYDDPKHWHPWRDHPGFEESDDVPPRVRGPMKP